MTARALAVVALIALAVVPTAAGHPFVAASDPGPDETLEPGDRVVVLRFGEAIDAKGLTVEVVGPDGRDQVETVTVEPDGRTVRVRTEPLSRGTYDVSWAATSTDGHPGEGQLAVTVGTDGSADEPAGSWSNIPGGRVALVTETVARGALLVGGVVAVGVAFVAGWLLAGRSAVPWRRVLRGATALAFVGSLGVVAVLAYRQGDLRTAASSTGGAIQLAVAGLAGGGTIAAAAATREVGRRSAIAAGGLSLAALAVDSLASHGQAGSTAAGIDGAWVMLVGLVHLVAAAVWVGVLVVLGLTARRDSGRAAVELARRLSPWAAGAVLAVGVSGLAYADAHLLRWQDLYTTQYGGLLLAKAGIVVVPLGIAAYHRVRVLPDGRGDGLRRTVPLELGVLVLVVVLAGLLGAHPRPAHPVVGEDLDRGLHHTATTADYRVTLVTPDPLTATAEEPVTVAVASQSLPGLSIPPPTVTVDPAGGDPTTVSLDDGPAEAWQLPNGTLSEPGPWHVTVHVDGPHGPATTSWTLHVQRPDGGDG